MTIKNQIDHRAGYAKQKAAGQIQDATGGRHGRNRPRLAAKIAQARRRPQRPLAAEGRSLAEQMGIPIPAEVRQRVDAAKAAKPLETLTPPATANVPETATPEVVVDPPQGELAPVAALPKAMLTPRAPRSWVDKPRDAADAMEAAEEDKEETGDAPLV